MTSQVLFYVLDNHDKQAALQFVCQLVCQILEENDVSSQKSQVSSYRGLSAVSKQPKPAILSLDPADKPRDDGMGGVPCKIERIQKDHSHASTLILTEDDALANHLNDLLWTFKETSFIPHALISATHPYPSTNQAMPVWIGNPADLCPNTQVIINLMPSIPAFNRHPSRVIELVYADDHIRDIVREKYKHYRQLSYELITHKLPT